MPDKARSARLRKLMIVVPRRSEWRETLDARRTSLAALLRQGPATPRLPGRHALPGAGRHRAPRARSAIAWDFLGTTSTYAQLLAESTAAPPRSRRDGLRAGDRILISMPTSPQGVIAFYAANRLGAVPALIHPLSTAPEITHYLDAERRAHRADAGRVLRRVRGGHAQAAAGDASSSRASRTTFRRSRRLGFWATKGRKIPPVPADPRVRWWSALLRRAHAARAPRSGGDHRRSGGDPVFRRHHRRCPRASCCRTATSSPQGMQAAAWGGMGEGDSILAILPIFHGFGLGVCVNAAFMAGGKSILVPQFSAELVAKLLRTQAPQRAGGRADAVRRARPGIPSLAQRRPVLPARLLLRRRHAAAAGEGALRGTGRAGRRAGEAARGLRTHRGGHRHHGDAARRSTARARSACPSPTCARRSCCRARPRRRRSARKARSASPGPAVMLRLPRRPRGHRADAARARRRPHLAAHRRPREDGRRRLLLFHGPAEAHDQVLGLQRLPGAGRGGALRASRWSPRPA